MGLDGGRRGEDWSLVNWEVNRREMGVVLGVGMGGKWKDWEVNGMGGEWNG